MKNKENYWAYEPGGVTLPLSARDVRTFCERDPSPDAEYFADGELEVTAAMYAASTRLSPEAIGFFLYAAGEDGLLPVNQLLYAVHWTTSGRVPQIEEPWGVVDGMARLVGKIWEVFGDGSGRSQRAAELLAELQELTNQEVRGVLP